MLRKVIKYKGYDGRERSEAFYFNLSKAELMEMEMTSDGGMENLLQSIIDTKENRKLFGLIKELIKRSYGVKSEDGRRFIKSEEISTAFMQTEAYTELLMDLMGDNAAEKLADFVKGVMPLDGLSETEINKAFDTAKNQLADNGGVIDNVKFTSGETVG